MARKKDIQSGDTDELNLRRGIDERTAALARASQILSGFPGALVTTNPETKDAALRSIIQELRSLLTSFEGQSVLYEDMREKPLSPDEYIIPPELIKDGHHQRLMDFLRNPKAKTTSLAHSGLLLFGTTGTGKTEYVRHLMHLLQENKGVIFVNGNISRIIRAPAPGDAIKELYRGIQAKAESGNTKYVLLFDEFEGLVRQLVKKLSSTRTTSTSMDTGPRRTHEHEEKEEVDEAEVDKTGEEIFAALKSVLKGTGGIDRVFTIATSNLNEFDAALESRLEAVEIKPIGMPFERFRSDSYMLCQHYPEIISRILELMQAMHFREHGAKNPALSQISDELAVLSGEVASISTNDSRGPYVSPEYISDNRQEAINKLWITRLLGLLNITVTGRELFDFTYNAKLESDGKRPPQSIDLSHQQIARDIYLRSINRFRDVDSAKRELAFVLFPKQLRKLERPEASE
jgi:hypothetical protein